MATAVVAVLLAACQSTGRKPSADPLTDVRNTELSTATRSDAVARAWASSAASPRERTTTRTAFKDLAWQPNGHHRALIECDQSVRDRADQRHVVFDHDQTRAHLVAQAQQHRRQRLDLALGDAG